MTNRTITLRARPHGPMRREDFGLEQRDVPSATDGQVVVRRPQHARARPSNLMMLVEKRITMSGFLVTDHGARMSEYAPAAARWLAEGKLKSHETIVAGFEQLPDAFIGLLRGDNVGKMVVRVSAT